MHRAKVKSEKDLMPNLVTGATIKHNITRAFVHKHVSRKNQVFKDRFKDVNDDKAIAFADGIVTEAVYVHRVM